MAVKIRLKRFGKMRAPYYRIVVADSRTKRDGRAIEEIGKYHPTEEPSFIEVNRERAQYWLGVGAQPTEQVAVLLKITGDWQTFKGEPGGEGTLKVKEPKAPITAPEPAKVADKAPKKDAPAKAKADAPAKAETEPATADAEPAKAEATPAEEAAPTSVDEVTPTPPAEAEVANAEAPEGADEQAEAGSAGTNA